MATVPVFYGIRRLDPDDANAGYLEDDSGDEFRHRYVAGSSVRTLPLMHGIKLMVTPTSLLASHTCPPVLPPSHSSDDDNDGDEYDAYRRHVTAPDQISDESQMSTVNEPSLPFSPRTLAQPLRNQHAVTLSFEHELDAELDNQMATLQYGMMAPAMAASVRPEALRASRRGQRAFYDDEYFDSDEEEEHGEGSAVHEAGGAHRTNGLGGTRGHRRLRQLSAMDGRAGDDEAPNRTTDGSSEMQRSSQTPLDASSGPTPPSWPAPPQLSQGAVDYSRLPSDIVDGGCAVGAKPARRRRGPQPTVTDDDLLYDPDEDDADQRWVDARRRADRASSAAAHVSGPASRTQPLAPRSGVDMLEEVDHGAASQRHMATDLNRERGLAMSAQSDAILNCAACMATLSLDCQRHEVHAHQYRAIFVLNCIVDRTEALQFPAPAAPAMSNRARKAQRFKAFVRADGRVREDERGRSMGLGCLCM